MAIDVLILDCAQELRLLRMTLSDPELPTADQEAICSRAVYAVSDLGKLQAELNSMIYDLVEQDHLYAQVALTREQKLGVLVAIGQLSTSLKNKLVHLQMYEQGILHYQFRELLDDDTIVLRQTGGPHSRLHHS